MRVDSNQRLIIGHTASVGEERALQVVGTGADSSSVQLIRHSANSASCTLDLTKSRNASPGSNTIVQENDTIGSISFRADDGTDLNTEGARITAFVDGTPGANDMPGRLSFQTTADGAGDATERLRIDKAGGFIFSNGMMIESVNITAGKLSDNLQVNLDNGVVHHFTTTETTTATPNLVSSVGINTTMATGDNMVVTIITTTAAAAYSAALKIDGSSATVKWVGGSAPSAGGSSGVDIYSYNIIKTGSGAYTVIGNLTNAA